MTLSAKQKSIMREINLGGMTIDQYEPKDRKVVAELMDMGLVKVGAYNLLSLTKKGDTAHDGMVAAADARGWHESRMDYASINESLEDIRDALDEDVLDEAELTEFEPVTAAAVAAGAYALKKAKDISHAERARKKGVSPNEYYDTHGKCPPGYNKTDSYGGTKCVPTKSKLVRKTLKVLNKKIF